MNLKDLLKVKKTGLDREARLHESEQSTAEEIALLDARLGAYEKDPESGCSWEEVETRIRARLSRQEKQ